MNKTLVLTGPIGVGKSTLAGLLGADIACQPTFAAELNRYV